MGLLGFRRHGPSFEYTGGFDDYPYPQSSFERRGRFLNLDTETGIGEILGIVASSDSNAEQVSTFEDYAISAPFLALGDLMRQRPAFVDCANAWVLNPDYLWYLPKCGLTELARRSPATSPKDTVETRADSTSPLRAGPADRHFISDPTEIRSLLEALRDHPSAGSAATTGPREGRSRDGVAPPDAEPPGRSRALNTGDAPLKGEGARNAGPGEGRPEPSTEVLQHPAGRAETPSEPPKARQPTLPPPPAPSPPAPSPPASSPAAVVPTSPPASPPVRPPGL